MKVQGDGASRGAKKYLLCDDFLMIIFSTFSA